MISHEGRARASRWLLAHGPMVALSILVVALAIGVQRTGHTWGDDFALYLRQAKSLVDGNIGQVIADNHFNVDNAAKPGFSPYVYPWGFPLLLAPVYRVFGRDYAAFKLVEVASLVAFLWGFHAVIRRRMDRWVAFATVAFVGTTFAYLVHTDKVVSELPYMAAVMLTLWWLDRIRRARPLDEATRWQLVALGLLAMLVFNIRREGVALVAAIGAAQLLDLRGRWRTADRRAVATPYVAFAGGVVLLQLLLPSALAPEYAGSGLGQTWKKLGGAFQLAFARQVGFDQLAGIGLLLAVLLVVAGIAVRLWRTTAEDAPLAVFAIGSMVIVGMIPAVADRYLLAITPFAVYFATQAVAAIPLPRRLAPLLTIALLAIGSFVHLATVRVEIRDAQAFDDAGFVVDGPETASSQAAFAAIRTYTHQDDVVAFFKVRALTYYTDRRGVQSSDLEILRQRSDYFLMRRNTGIGQPWVTADDAEEMGWTEVWSNAEWVLWRLPLYEPG